MRWLPRGLVVHRWVPEADATSLQPIAVSTDGKFTHLARPETIEAFNRMAADALKENVRLKIIWAFRSSGLQIEQYRQAQVKHGRRGAIRWLAPPGYSEHHTGWTLDIGDADDPEADDNPLFERTAAFHWLRKNAGNYRFELSFPPDNWQGVGYEPWHWRYAGTAESQRAFHPAGLRAVAIWGRSFLKALAEMLK
jgi:D-alanyl-D-alanine carboxypeptidase